MEWSNTRFKFILGFSLLLSIGFSSSAIANTFIYNPKTLTWKAINDSGKVVRTGKGSGGSHYCKDIRRGCKTPAGVYSILSKGGAGCRSTRYPVGRGGAPMPYCMFFSKYYAIHGSYELPNYNASHGCVRVKPSEASWLSKNFIKIGTKVIIQPY
ncbi:L,D-transpeptidase [Legionella sp. km772]|uniref:L,D-transpeptidase n=1 Tax=Legionella sp. km772 TaxID=2498111 RepID=UPI000F8F7A09|nr:L,D-transpeptidase [Legionella sp. km772]RUR12156.1 L,D-transpeptidase [Legionella sp. km772]